MFRGIVAKIVVTQVIPIFPNNFGENFLEQCLKIFHNVCGPFLNHCGKNSPIIIVEYFLKFKKIYLTILNFVIYFLMMGNFLKHFFHKLRILCNFCYHDFRENPFKVSWRISKSQGKRVLSH